MPEGPEVKVIQEGLDSTLKNKFFKDVKILSGRYTRHDPPELFQKFHSQLPIKCLSVNCKGKFIWFTFERNWFLWNTLGMTGGWSQKQSSHDRVQFNTEVGNIYFSDIRNFGTLKFSNDVQELNKKLDSLGPDMLSDNVSFEVFKAKIWKNRFVPITEFLMNQKNISGVGNYIKSESLYLAGISPHKKCYQLKNPEIEKLLTSIKEVMQKSYLSNGATIKDYKGFDGEKGDFSFQFEVYGKYIDRKGREVLKEETSDGRSTFWVPEVQK